MATYDEHDAPSEALPVNGDGGLYGVLAEFDTPGELVEAARKVRDAGYTDFDCFSPFPVHGIDEAMGIKRTILPVLIFGGGFAGIETIGDLVSKTESELAAIPNFGKKSIEEVRETLQTHGLTLRDE